MLSVMARIPLFLCVRVYVYVCGDACVYGGEMLTLGVIHQVLPALFL